jgi:DNA-binding CsgD family transcriptional regulator
MLDSPSRSVPPNARCSLQGLRVARFSLGADDLVVLSFPVRPTELPPVLTAAERAVVEAMLSGKTNPEIARARGTSTRTVANQIANAFQKLEVSSRGELAARFAGSLTPGAR